jgi:hypothetical protein
MSMRGRGAVRQWTKTCSEYDESGNATEILYQTVLDGKIYEIHATHEEVVFCVSPRRQVRLTPSQVLDALGSSGNHLEDALDLSFLLADKPSSIQSFNALVARFPRQTIDRPLSGMDGDEEE